MSTLKISTDHFEDRINLGNGAACLPPVCRLLPCARPFRQDECGTGLGQPCAQTTYANLDEDRDRRNIERQLQRATDRDHNLESQIARASAAPILFEAFARSGSAPAALPQAPRGAIFAAGKKLPPPLQRFGIAGPSEAVEAPRIMFPPDGARLEIAAGAQPDPVALKISGGRGPLTVLVNGVPTTPASGRGTLFFQPDGPGFVRLTVMDALGASDSVTVRLQ